MSRTLDTLLDLAQGPEHDVISDVAVRAGLLWRCTACANDNYNDASACGDCGQQLADICIAGQPDPTATGIPSSEVCRRSSPDPADEFICTRRRDHVGRQHVAGDGTRVQKAWPWLS